MAPRILALDLSRQLGVSAIFPLAARGCVRTRVGVDVRRNRSISRVCRESRWDSSVVVLAP